jgi:hypothetical protein
VGLEYFRANILEEKSIGVTPVEGYHTKRRNSRMATAWLDYYEFEFFKNKIIRQYRIVPYFVDGFINEPYTHPKTGVSYTAIALEFWGCYYHENEDCGKETLLRRPQFKRKTTTKKRNIFLLSEFECDLQYSFKFTSDN